MTPTATTAPASGAIVTVETAETSVLSRWDALANQIAEASEHDAKLPAFDYRNKHDNKAARSWIAQLRKLNAKIEASRKEAKAIHLERGRAVDATAKLLAESVAGLIERHAEPIAAIEAEEAARVRAHEAVLQRIDALSRAQVTTGGFTFTASTSADAKFCLSELQAIDITGLEEFQEIAAGAMRNATAELEARIADLETREAEAAELAALRAAAAQREQEEREERIRQEAAQRAAEQERAAAAERERAAAAEAFLAEQRAAQAEAAAADAQRRAAELEQQEQARQRAEADRVQREAERAAVAAQAEQERRLDLIAELTATGQGLGHPRAVAEAIVAGTFHPALRIEWGLVRAGEALPF